MVVAVPNVRDALGYEPRKARPLRQRGYLDLEHGCAIGQHRRRARAARADLDERAMCRIEIEQQAVCRAQTPRCRRALRREIDDREDRAAVPVHRYRPRG
jgi:hypothetical protein